MATRRIAALVLLAAVVPIAAKKQKLSEYLEGTLWNWNNWREVKYVFIALHRPFSPRGHHGHPRSHFLGATHANTLIRLFVKS